MGKTRDGATEVRKKFQEILNTFLTVLASFKRLVSRGSARENVRRSEKGERYLVRGWVNKCLLAPRFFFIFACAIFRTGSKQTKRREVTITVVHQRSLEAHIPKTHFTLSLIYDLDHMI